MSTPRDRDRDDFDDGRPDGPAGWQEPAHLGGGHETPAGPTGPTGPAQPDDRRAGTCPRSSPTAPSPRHPRPTGRGTR
jgi:hypothetical protein